MGLALIMYGREEGAETLIEQMTRDQDPILRCAPPPPLSGCSCSSRSCMCFDAYYGKQFG
jgi:hypothetical protein